jgi:AraC-like DNA-binding protein
MGDIKIADLVLAALGDLIFSYMIVCRSNIEFSEPVEKIRASIRRNYSHPDYALDEVMRSMPFHYDYLRKLFKKEVGVSPLEYLTDLRMKSAETLLTAMWTNEYSITEIAQMCGFADSLYFSRVFKKHFGCAPSNYAQKNPKNYPKDPGRTELPEEEI